MKYLTTKQVAELWNISQRRVAILCDKGQIMGVEKAGKSDNEKFEPESDATRGEHVK